MRRISTLLLLCLSVASFNSYSQNCASSQPNPNVCSGTVAQNFNSSNGGFSASTNFNYTGTNFQRVFTTTTQQVLTITSPSFYKTDQQVNSVTAGFLLTVGSRVTVTGVTLEVLDANTNAVIATCPQTVSVSNTSQTICISISSTDITVGRMIKYRFTITATANSTGGSDAQRSVTFDDFSYGGDSNAPLPVNFLGFEGKKETAGIRLTWKVDVEDHARGYEVEKSTDGRSYTSIGFVAAAGLSTYSFVDTKPEAISYYRVKGVDVDGKYRYSPIVSMKNGKSAVVLKAFPMPANKLVTIQHSNAKAGSTLSLYTESGVLVKSVKLVANAQQTEIDLSVAKPGFYMVRFDDGQGNLETIKIIKQ